jgi:hypothetical protein
MCRLKVVTGKYRREYENTLVVATVTIVHTQQMQWTITQTLKSNLGPRGQVYSESDATMRTKCT